MTRCLAALFAGILLGSAATAQSSFARDAGPYVALDAVDLLRLGDRQLEVGGRAGWRFGNGLDAGLRLGAEHTTFDASDRTVSEARRLAVGVEAGYTAWVGDETGLRMGVLGGLQQTVEVGAPTYLDDGSGAVAVIDRGNRDVNVGEVTLSAEAFHRLPVGRVILQPTAGLFGGGGVTATADADQPFTLRADAGRRTNTQSAADALGGVFGGLPVLVEIGGTVLGVDLRAAYDAVREQSRADVRLNVNL